MGSGFSSKSENGISGGGDSEMTSPPVALNGVMIMTTTGEMVRVGHCRGKAMEVYVDGKWSRTIDSIAVREGAGGAELTTFGGALICKMGVAGGALNITLTRLTIQADAAGVPHSLSYLQNTSTTPPSADASTGCPYCGMCQSYSMGQICPRTGKRHPPVMNWAALSGLPAGASQECKTEVVTSTIPQMLQQAWAARLPLATKKDENCVRFTSHAGAMKLVLHNTGQIEVYSTEGKLDCSAKRLEADANSGRLHLLCSEDEVPMLSLKGISHSALVDTARLADKAGIDHNIWRQLEGPAGEAFACPACTYLNSTGVSCKLCGAPKPPPSDPIVEAQKSADVVGKCSHCNVTLTPDAPQFCRVTGKSHSIVQKQQPSKHSVTLRSKTATCSCCMKRPKNTVLMPCKHVGACGSCATDLTCCPICEMAVTHRLEIWL